MPSHQQYPTMVLSFSLKGMCLSFIVVQVVRLVGRFYTSTLGRTRFSNAGISEMSFLEFKTASTRLDYAVR